MRSTLKKMAFAILVCVVMSTAALAEKKSEKVTFSRDMMVNGNVVKKGTYKVAVDEQSNELTLLNGKEVVAKMKYRKETRTYKSGQPVVTFTHKDNAEVLATITFANELQTFIVSDEANQAATPQQ